MRNVPPKHIVFMRRLSDGAVWGGGERILLDYLKKIDYTRYKITLVATHDIFSETFKKENIPVSIVLFKEYVDMVSFERLKVMFNKIRELKPDRLIFIEGGFRDFGSSDFVGAFLAAKGRLLDFHFSSPMKLDYIKTSKRYFGFIPGVGFWWYRRMWRFVIRGMLPRKIIVLSKDVKRRMVEWYGAPASKVQVIYHGINLKNFFPDTRARFTMRAQMNIPAGDTVIIYTGRLSPEKCLERIVGAFEKLQNEFSNIWLIFVGDGPVRTQLEERVRQGNCASKIRFLGAQNQVVDFLRMSDIFVLSSDYEGLSNSMLEAMATGLITVVTNVSGSDDAITNGENGFIVERSEDGITQGLRNAIGLSAEAKEQIIAKAIASVHAKFDANQGIKNILQALELN